MFRFPICVSGGIWRALGAVLVAIPRLAIPQGPWADAQTAKQETRLANRSRRLVLRTGSQVPCGPA